MKITDYSEQQIKEMYKAGLVSSSALRDYEALKALERGEKVTAVAMDANVTRMTIFRIRKKYL